MPDPLTVHVTGAISGALEEKILAIRAELERRGVSPLEVRVEAEPPGGIPPGGIAVDARVDPRRAAEEILSRLSSRSGGPKTSVYTPEEEEEVRRRLEDLGYS